MHRHARRHRIDGAGERGYGEPADVGLPHASAGALSILLHTADSGTRQRLTSELHVRHGNAGVAELIEGREPRVRDSLAGTVLADIVASFDELIGVGEETEEGEEATLAPTSSGTTINVQEGSAIEVSGTLAQAGAALAARKEAGSVTSHIADIYFFPDGKDPVRLANITINETRQLPKWTDKGKAPEPEQKEWDRFLAAITVHEDQHIAIDERTFDGLHKKCLNKTHEAANAAIDAAESAAQHANDTFDADTSNGRSAGTVINPNVGTIEKVP